MSNYRYEVNEDLELRVWEGEAELPFLLQPFNPDNDNKSWADEAEAAAYGQKIIDDMEENARRVAEDPDYYKKQLEERQAREKQEMAAQEGKSGSDYGFPTSTNFSPVFSKEQQMLIEQAQEDSERIKRIEEAVMQLLKGQA
jgi:hypothetical protein